jgi:hypothetical protein
MVATKKFKSQGLILERGESLLLRSQVLPFQVVKPGASFSFYWEVKMTVFNPSIPISLQPGFDRRSTSKKTDKRQVEVRRAWDIGRSSWTEARRNETRRSDVRRAYTTSDRREVARADVGRRALDAHRAEIELAGHRVFDERIAGGVVMPKEQAKVELCENCELHPVVWDERYVGHCQFCIDGMNEQRAELKDRDYPQHYDNTPDLWDTHPEQMRLRQEGM